MREGVKERDRVKWRGIGKEKTSPTRKIDIFRNGKMP